MAYYDNVPLLSNNGDVHYPQTKTNSVYDSAGKNLDVVLNDKADKSYVETSIAEAKSTNYGYRYKADVTIYGDPNLYYPVVIKGGDQSVKRDIMVKRMYYEQAPPDWNTPTHMGGLTLKIKANFGGWGGANYAWEVHELEEMYSRMFAGAMNTGNQCMFAIFLRGGGTTGAIYHIYSDQTLTANPYNSAGDVPPSPQVCLNQDKIFDYDFGNGNYYIVNAPAPRTLTASVEKEISDRLFIKLAQSTATAVTNLTTVVNGKEPTIPTGTTAQYFRGDKTWQALNKAAVGLSNVDNTSDANKPISAATQTALNGKVDNSRVLTDVPIGAKFTDTLTTINGKTGAITKADITALGIPSADTNTTYTAGTGLTLTGTVFTPTFGTTAGTIAQGNDSRLSDARTPLAHTHTKANITDFAHTHTIGDLPAYPTTLPANGGSADTAKSLIGDDTRGVNSEPSVYMTGGSRHYGRTGWQTEFKTIATMGLTSFLTGTYCYVETKTPWSDPSGGYPIQIAYGAGEPCWRVGTSATTWSSWKPLNSGGDAATVGGLTVGKSVPANAVFTDTVTTVNGKTGAISKADIVALGIPAQDTVYTHPTGTNPHGTTKADVGLINVDNTSDSTKNVLSATKLTTARNIAGVAFDGTKNIDISYNSLTDKPVIPAGAVVNNTLTSTSTTASLSANQGRILNETKAPSGYGLGQELVNVTVTNSNNALTTGMFYATSADPNKPLGVTDGALFVTAHSSNWVNQMYMDWRTNATYRRIRANGVWGAWEALVTLPSNKFEIKYNTANDSLDFNYNG